MYMREYIVNKNQRITIPHQLRKNYGIEKGMKVWFVEETNGIKVIPVESERVYLVKLNHT